MNKFKLMIMVMIATSSIVSASAEKRLSREESIEQIFQNKSRSRQIINHISREIDLLEKIESYYPSSLEIKSMIQLRKDESRITALLLANANQYNDKNNPKLQSLVDELDPIRDEIIGIMPEVQRLINKYEKSWCTIS